jgi:hypothetical protein
MHDIGVSPKQGESKCGTLDKWVFFYPLFFVERSPSSEFSLHHCLKALENIFFLE